jgi:hypothetical protein
MIALRVLVVDDHSVVRRGVVSYLDVPSAPGSGANAPATARWS